MPIEKLDKIVNQVEIRQGFSSPLITSIIFDKINQIIDHQNKIEEALVFLAEEVSITCIGSEGKKFLMKKIKDLLS